MRISISTENYTLTFGSFWYWKKKEFYSSYNGTPDTFVHYFGCIMFIRTATNVSEIEQYRRSK